MTIDIAAYVRTPVLNLATAISLGDTLVEAAPSDLEGVALKAKARLAAASGAARDAIVERHRVLSSLPERDTRTLDHRADRVWRGLRSRLTGLAVLADEGVPDGERAAELIVALFEPEGLRFLQESYPVQLTLMQATLQRIDEDGLAADIDRCAGAAFLTALRPIVKEYGEMVSDGLRKAEAEAVDFTEHLANLRQLIVDYATRVYALIDPDDPSSEDKVRAALLPIAKLRDRGLSTSDTTGDEGEEDSPPVAPDAAGS